MYRALLVIFCLLGPTSVGAQFAIPEVNTQLAITPTHPAPGETVTIELRDYAVSEAGAGVTWLINGEVADTVANERTITLTAGAIGEQTTVEAIQQTGSGVRYTASASFSVSDVVVIVEADTHTPHWYRGRPAPSIGSQTRLTAFPNTGENLPPQTYSYRWRQGEQVLGGGTRQGAFQTTITHGYGRGETVSVDVIDRDGAVVARKQFFVETREPELYFYQVNPLRGVATRALPNSFPLLSAELNVRAEPYFIANDLFAANPIRFWQVNGQEIDNPNTDQEVVTLRNGGGGGSFLVEYHIRNPRELLQGVEKGFNVQF